MLTPPIERTRSLQRVHAAGLGGTTGQILRELFTGFCHSHNDSPIIQRLQPSYTNNLTPPPLLRRDNERDTDAQADLLMRMSTATIDRKLAGQRANGQADPAGTVPHQARHAPEIPDPVRTWAGWDDAVPGFVEIDLVGHEGGNNFGEFCFTLTVTDIATGWTVNRSERNKAVEWVFEALEHVTAVFPSPIIGIDSDNGSEIIKDHLLAYCHAHRSPSPAHGRATRTTAPTWSRRTGRG
ncbi:hypothetical protein Q9R30_00265 [Arthrobacter sp. AB6]|uniref:hypothetical protein n=1 Tax=Arthrobacter sp. AB6 TaxID=2962570 RepID=UPI002882B1FA|nr:hypothetical protein [Arthrobacter sp. AB6]MDT0193785.1 hypothetical protein [Arthrobacter sp. AB6]